MFQTSFRHVNPPLRVYYGADCLQQLGAELDRVASRRAVIFCGQSVARLGNGLAIVQAALGERCAGVFSGVMSHSPIPAVLAGRDALRGYDADAVIAVGGGSAMVSARAATILLAEDKSIHALCTTFTPGQAPVSPRLLRPKLPQFAVPTTPTTAYAKAGTAVLDPAQHRRLTMFDPKTRAQAIFIHPELTLSAPPGLACDASLNALVMAIQGLESATREPLADALLLHAVRLIQTHLPRLAAAPDDAELRGQLMLAALLSGQGTDYTGGGGLASVIGHCIGARFALDNGLTNAILLPHTIRFNAPATGQRLALAADLFGAPADDGIAAFFAGLGLPARLRDLGIARDALPQIAADAGTDWFLFQNPRPVAGPDDLMAVLTAAW